jgi:hypothetical protein
MVSSHTPWDLLRCNILWQLWCSRCGLTMRGEIFHLGTAILRAWQTTVRTAIAIWRSITALNHGTQHAKKIDIFYKVWATNSPFCDMTSRNPKFNLIPDSKFLPHAMAIRPRLSRQRYTQIVTIRNDTIDDVQHWNSQDNSQATSVHIQASSNPNELNTNNDAHRRAVEEAERIMSNILRGINSEIGNSEIENNIQSQSPNDVTYHPPELLHFHDAHQTNSLDNHGLPNELHSPRTIQALVNF